MSRTRSLQADLATVPSVGIGSRSVVALPPSDLDPFEVVGGTAYDATTTYDATTRYVTEHLYGRMRVYISGTRILRDYDPALEQP